MGKLKKPSKNAYYFFVMAEKEKHEAMGYRIPGGFNNYSHTFGRKWSELTKEQKAPYEQMAKEAKEQEKYNENNKFTVTGETYAQVHEKNREIRCAQECMEEFVHELASGPGAGGRMIIFMKAVYSVEEIIDRKTRQYWPSELAMVAFSLQGGIKSIYTQLVDTLEAPTGYASQAKENCEETLLPMPGNETLFTDDCRNYQRILRNIHGFMNHWLKDGYPAGHRRVVFCLDYEREPIVSCLQWLVNQLPMGMARDKYQRFVTSLKVYKVSKLILHLAEEAHEQNPEYNNYLVNFKLESAADDVIKKGNYDYREEIACGYHRLDFASLKMHNCAQSIVMRRAYMLFEEFVPAFKYTWCERHRISGVGKSVRGPIIKKKREKSPAKEEMKKVEEPSWLKNEELEDMDTWDYSQYNTTGAPSASAAPTAATYNAWGTRPAPPTNFEDDDFPTLGATGGGAAPSSSSYSRRKGPTNSSIWERRSSTTSSVSSHSPPPPTHHSSSSSCGYGGAAASSVSSPPSASASSAQGAGAKSKKTASWFDDDDDDYPNLGAATVTNYSPPSPQGAVGGRGRANAGIRSFVEEDEDEDFPTLGASMAGRGRGGGGRY